MRRGKCGIVLALLAAMLVVPAMAFADQQLKYIGADNSEKADIAAVWAAIAATALGGIDELKPSIADNTVWKGKGILDVVEFKVLDEILKNVNAPNHNVVHEAFKANRAAAITALGQSGNFMFPHLCNLMAAYATFGEWDFFFFAIDGLKDNGLQGIVVPTSASVCDFSASGLLGPFCDLDGDGVTNGCEYAANTAAWPLPALNPATVATAPFATVLPESAWHTVVNDDKLKVCGVVPSVFRFFYDTNTGHLYGVLPQGESYLNGAKITAQSIVLNDTPLPAHLVTITSQAEQDFIYPAVRPYVQYFEYNNAHPPVLEEKGDFYLGCTDFGHEGTWTWDSGEAWEYTNWADGEPNNSKSEEHWAQVKVYDGKWRDDDLYSSCQAVFEFNGTFADDNSDGIPDTLAALFVTLPTAAFSATPTSGDMPLEVEFTDESLANGPAITAWAWDFDSDGTVDSTEQHPTHTFMATDPSSTYDVTLTVTNPNGSKTLVKNDYITVNYVCAFDGQLSAQGEAFHASVMAGAGSIKDLLVSAGVNSFGDWDIEGIELGGSAGDGLPDLAQMKLIQAVACQGYLPGSAAVFAGMDTNKELFLADMEAAGEAGAAYEEYADFFAGMIGSSFAMKDTINSLLGGILASYDDYVVLSDGAKIGGEMFSASGDLDNDGETNLEEYNTVIAAGGSIDTFVIAATTPSPFWPGNPELPVAGVLGLGLLAGSLLVGAGVALRRK